MDGLPRNPSRRSPSNELLSTVDGASRYAVRSTPSNVILLRIEAKTFYSEEITQLRPEDSQNGKLALVDWTG